MSLSPGQEVLFDWEAVNQDGFNYRATAAAPAAGGPLPEIPPPANSTNNPGDAYRSGLSIRIDRCSND